MDGSGTKLPSALARLPNPSEMTTDSGRVLELCASLLETAIHADITGEDAWEQDLANLRQTLSAVPPGSFSLVVEVIDEDGPKRQEIVSIAHPSPSATGLLIRDTLASTRTGASRGQWPAPRSGPIVAFAISRIIRMRGWRS